MRDFQFYTPTRVVFGKESIEKTGSLVKAQGAKKVLVHYGGGSAVRSGLLARITAALDAEGIAYVTLGGVKPNPRLSLVYEGIELCRKEGVDFILGVGGGSVLDSAKAIGYGLANFCDVWDLFDGKASITGCLPIGAVLTISAAGSEMSNSCVITNDYNQMKKGIGSDYCKCRFAIMDPTITYTLPEYQTMSGATDIMMHTMERFFTVEEGMYLTDSIAEGLLRTVIDCMKTLKVDPENYEARANVMWASSLSHNGLTGCGGVGGGDWATHQLEHALGAMFDVAHGAGLAAVWGSWARYVMDVKPERFARFAHAIFGIADSGDVSADAEAGICAFEDFMCQMGMPTRIHEMGIDLTEEELLEMSDKCAYYGTRKIGVFKVLDRNDIEAIYRMAR